jgi:hypothetical protein
LIHLKSESGEESSSSSESEDESEEEKEIVQDENRNLINFLVFSVIIKTENYEIIFINNKSGNSIRDKVQITINSYQERQNEIRIEKNVFYMKYIGKYYSARLTFHDCKYVDYDYL